MTDDILSLTASGLNRAYAEGQLSPVTVAKACLARIERLNPVLNAFCLVDRGATMDAARRSERRWLDGTALGPLDGVPVSIKDLLLTRGWPTLRGSKTVDPAQTWTEDSPPVARLREAGAVLLGKTTTPEFAWKGVTDSPLTGVTRNPWNPDRTPGGSSGGASAAVAAGMGPLALGTDAGGSLRIPAAFCGLFTIKPTVGRVPSYPPTPYGSFASTGPISWTVEDAARVLNVLSGSDSRDAVALPPLNRDFADGLDADLEALRIGWSPDLGYARPESDVLAAAETAVRGLESLGFRVEVVAPPFDDPSEIYEDLRRGMTVSAFAWANEEKLALMDPGLVDHIRESREKATLQRYLAADAARGALGRTMAAFHGKYDLLATPCVTRTAFDVGTDGPPDAPNSRIWSPYTFPFNLTRQPAVSLPCGTGRDGLPVGLQLVAPLYGEARLLAVSRRFERAFPWFGNRPTPVLQEA